MLYNCVTGQGNVSNNQWTEQKNIFPENRTFIADLLGRKRSTFYNGKIAFLKTSFNSGCSYVF